MSCSLYSWNICWIWCGKMGLKELKSYCTSHSCVFSKHISYCRFALPDPNYQLTTLTVRKPWRSQMDVLRPLGDAAAGRLPWWDSYVMGFMWYKLPHLARDHRLMLADPVSESYSPLAAKSPPSSTQESEEDSGDKDFCFCHDDAEFVAWCPGSDVRWTVSDPRLNRKREVKGSWFRSCQSRNGS